MRVSRIGSAFVAAGALVAGFSVAGGATASADQPSEGHKVWVCHATAGLGELKNGYDLIEVDTSSTQYEAHLAHATEDPKDNPTFGLLYDYIDVDPSLECVPPKKLVPTTTVAPTTVAVAAPTTAAPTTTALANQAPLPTTTMAAALPITGNGQASGQLLLLGFLLMGFGSVVLLLSRRPAVS